VKDIGRRVGGTYITIKRRNPSKRKKNRKRKKGDFIVVDAKTDRVDNKNIEGNSTDSRITDCLRRVAIDEGIRGRKLEGLMRGFNVAAATQEESAVESSSGSDDSSEDEDDSLGEYEL
jgi:hypothetical protein